MESRGRTNSNGNGHGNGDGHRRSQGSAVDADTASRSNASFTAPPTSEHDMTHTAQRGVVGFFDRALERWHALARRGGRRMRDADNDPQLIARGARDRYMRGPRPEDESRDFPLPGPRNEGAYTYPMPVGERGMERARHYVNPPSPGMPSRPRFDAPRPPDHRPGAEPMRPPAAFDERYGGARRWHRENDREEWDHAAFDNWDANVRGPSSADGRDQWSHPIPYDPRSDSFTPQSDDRRPLSLAPFGERTDRYRDERNRSYPAAPTPTWRGRDRGRR
jgi:hypothetical protein